MHRPIVRSALMACAFALAASQALAQPRQVEIPNHTSHAMIQFFASSVTTQEWGEDMLGRVLPAGQSRSLTLNGGAANGCLYDLKAVFDDGRTAEVHSVNICRGPVPPFQDEPQH